MKEHDDNSAELRIKSCIFYNFYNQIRAGLNSTIIIEKCHLSECRNNAVHAVNPKVFKIINCTVSKPIGSGILCEWLSYSHASNKGRQIFIEGNEIYGSGKEGIAVVS